MHASYVLGELHRVPAAVCSSVRIIILRINGTPKVGSNDSMPSLGMALEQRHHTQFGLFVRQVFSKALLSNGTMVAETTIVMVDTFTQRVKI